jgi:Asp-tRNA(Asn)/Glu-tRNA(Gln) amidotransferase A subunit family amidase
MAKRQRIQITHLPAAEKLIGLHFTAKEHKLMIDEVNAQLAGYEQLRAIPIDNGIPPALSFDPRLPGMTFETKQRQITYSKIKTPRLPDNAADIAFWPITQLAALIRSKQISSVELTKLYLERLHRYDPILRCVVTFTDDRAVQQARRADREIARGDYRGLLHGIPYGAKDLLATRGIRTTWGAEPYRDQVPAVNATVIDRLEEAGAVLIAKLSVGALAWGDVWLDGVMTKNPWNLEEGSSGSSAGSGSATAAGLVGFAIGTETLGSIISPATQCRITGLRPTFGRVSRFGAMALSWSMDKIGPMCRSVEDCAIVFDAMRGSDGRDLTVTDFPFNYDARVDVKQLRVGYVRSAFAKERENKANDDETLRVLKSLGIKLIPIELPQFPYEALTIILFAEAAAAFDELTRSNRDDLLARQVKEAWPNAFRRSRLIPAVEFLQASRIRTLAMLALQRVMHDIDVYVTPSFDEADLTRTNLTGHPAVVVPNGVTSQGHSSSITFTGKLYGEAAALAVAKAYQDATDFQRQRPGRFLPDHPENPSEATRLQQA